MTNNIMRPSGSTTAFAPPPINSVEDTGLNVLWLQDLALKILYNQGFLSGFKIAEAIALPFAGVTDGILEALKREKMIEVKSSQGGLGEGAYTYGITGAGITRAREQLVVTSAEVRRLYGGESYNMLSRFVREIPDDLIQEVRPKARFTRPGVQAAPSMHRERAEADTGLFVGQRVNHARFGDGIVLNLEGQGPQSRVQVNFEAAGSKWLIASMANLQPA